MIRTTSTPLVLSLLLAASTATCRAQQFAELDAPVPRLPSVHDWTMAVAIGDVDGDGDLDLILGNNGAPNRLLLNDGRARLVDGTAGRLPVDQDATAALAMLDADGDGDLDVVYGNGGGQQNRLLINDGHGRFTDATRPRLPLHGDATGALAVGDVDGDGSPDLVCANVGPNRLYVNDGTGTFTDATIGNLPSGSHDSHAVALGDVDGDGDLDLYCGTWGGDPYRPDTDRLYLNDGRGRFLEAAPGQLPPFYENTADVALGDVDGDGDLDLVVACAVSWDRYSGSPVTFSGVNQLLLNDGRGWFTSTWSGYGGNDTSSVRLGDLDEDGDLDILFGNRPHSWYCGGNACRIPGTNRCLLNDGRGGFRDVTTERMPAREASTWALGLADLDGDGDLDLVCGDGHGVPSRIYVNRHRQLDLPLPAAIGNPLRLDLTAKPGYGPTLCVALPALAAGETRLSLPPFGTWGLDPATMVALPPLLLAPSLGTASLELTVPADPQLVGMHVLAQALILDPVEQSRFTNAAADVVRD